jgi:hypothetical protein
VKPTTPAVGNGQAGGLHPEAVGISPAALLCRVAHQGLCHIGIGLVRCTLPPPLLLFGASAGSRSGGVACPLALGAGVAGVRVPPGAPVLGAHALSVILRSLDLGVYGELTPISPCFGSVLGRTGVRLGAQCLACCLSAVGFTSPQGLCRDG